MKFVEQSKVNDLIATQHKADIDNVNNYIDGLKGVIVSVEIIRSGQPAPYRDSVTEAIIFCHQPNSYTTNAPMLRTITLDEAKQVAKIFVGQWSDDPGPFGTRLVSFKAVPNPGKLKERPFTVDPDQVRSSAWHVVIQTPYCD